MATVLDTSALVVLIRSGRRAEQDAIADAARTALGTGRGLVSVVSAAELLVGARTAAGGARLARLLGAVPVVPADREVGELAGAMGAAARAAGETIPLADLLIAATASWLDVPLLTADSDFDRGRRLGASRDSPWAGFRLHPASVRLA